MWVFVWSGLIGSGLGLKPKPLAFVLQVGWTPFFSHVSNIPENWGILRKEPFKLETYINENDSENVKSLKAKWLEEFKNLQPWFDINQECVKYCLQDVRVLLKSSLKFVVQTFQFGEEMIARFGKSLAYKEGLCMPHFHPFNKGCPTLGSYS